MRNATDSDIAVGALAYCARGFGKAEIGTSDWLSCCTARGCAGERACGVTLRSVRRRWSRICRPAYRATIVSGEVTYRNGEPTDALPGRLVR